MTNKNSFKAKRANKTTMKSYTCLGNIRMKIKRKNRKTEGISHPDRINSVYKKKLVKKKQSKIKRIR